jgi:hypothetical protein
VSDELPKIFQQTLLDTIQTKERVILVFIVYMLSKEYMGLLEKFYREFMFNDKDKKITDSERNAWFDKTSKDILNVIIKKHENIYTIIKRMEYIHTGHS